LRRFCDLHGSPERSLSIDRLVGQFILRTKLEEVQCYLWIIGPQSFLVDDEDPSEQANRYFLTTIGPLVNRNNLEKITRFFRIRIRELVGLFKQRGTHFLRILPLSVLPCFVALANGSVDRRLLRRG
jgi:hypothetical protein